MNGWISIARDIQNHWLWREKRKLSKFEAWMSILLKANYKNIELMVGKQKVELKRGSFITSELKLADEWRWSRDTVRKFLKQLQDEEMISVKHTTKYTIIIVENWDLYQNLQQQTIQGCNNKLYNNQSRNQTLKNVVEWMKHNF